jgi:uncharacterized membrane protein
MKLSPSAMIAVGCASAFGAIGPAAKAVASTAKASATTTVKRIRSARR